MVARTADPVAFNADPMAAENGDMMAGANIYRRVQTRKKSGLTYAVPAVIVIALGAGVAFYAMKPAAAPTLPAAVSQQQADNSAAQAANAASSADSSAKVANAAANDQAQAASVSSTGAPPAASTDTQRAHDSAPVRHAQQASVRVRPTATSAGSTGSNVSAYTPAPTPNPLGSMQAVPAPITPATVTPDQVTPAPVTVQPAPTTSTTDTAPTQTTPGAVN